MMMYVEDVLTGVLGGRGVRIAAVTLMLAVMCSMAQAAVSIKEVKHTYSAGTVPAYQIENEHMRLTVVPQRGGRVVEWVDKHDQADLVWISPDATSYGGLLDDHENFAGLAYDAKIASQTKDRVELVLTGVRDDGVEYIKTVIVEAGKPLIQVDYELVNSSQRPVRTLFRNVIRPSGPGEVTEQDIYSFPTREGIMHTPKGFGRSGHTDSIGGPWMAFTSQSKRRSIVTVFEGDVIRRFYAWRDSKLAPTYEYMFKQLEPGEQFKTTAYWQLAHGLKQVDHATREVVMAVQPFLQQQKLAVNVDVMPVWQSFDAPKVTVRWLDADRKPLGEPVSASLDQIEVGKTGQLTLTGPEAAQDRQYVILDVAVEAQGKPVTRMETTQAFTRDGKMEGYKLEPQWLSVTKVETVPGWKKHVAYVVTPDEADTQRGYVLYEPFGEKAGRRVERIELHMGVGEPETLPVYIHALKEIGKLAWRAELPAGIGAQSLKIMAGEAATHTDWGHTHVGWKLLEVDTFTPEVKKEGNVWIRVNTTGWQPGRYVIPVTFEPEHAPASKVELVVHVHPVWFPQRPSYSFYAHMLLNFLASDSNPQTYKREWNFDKGLLYFKDLQAHGNKVMSSYAQNALTGHGWNAIMLRAKVRGSDITLGEAIKKNPELFQSDELPELDFSFWDRLFDESIAHGFTYYRTYLGGTGGVRNAFLPISRQVWQQPEMVETDPRHERIHRWMYTQITRYIRDRGYRLLTAIIDDEIPHEKYAQWVSDAIWVRELGFHPGVTQSNTLLQNEKWLKQMSPGLDVSVIGAFKGELLRKRLEEGSLKPLHVETYESSANYWKPYDAERSFTGFFAAFLPLDACWIQCYYRWNQSEAIIFPSEHGPITTAAWEGVRDGMDDANYYRMALELVKRTEAADAARGKAARAKLEALVGTQDGAKYHIGEQKNRMGVISKGPSVDTAVLRGVKHALLELIVELREDLPPQPRALRYDTITLNEGDVMRTSVQGPRKAQAQLTALLTAIESRFAFAPQKQASHRVVLATVDDLGAVRPALPESFTRDLSPAYPRPGDYVIRSSVDARGRAVVALVGGDDAGLEKAVRFWAEFIEHSISDGRANGDQAASR